MSGKAERATNDARQIGHEVKTTPQRAAPHDTGGRTAGAGCPRGDRLAVDVRVRSAFDQVRRLARVAPAADSAAADCTAADCTAADRTARSWAASRGEGSGRGAAVGKDLG